MTEDFDFWLARDPQNATRVIGALNAFGFGDLGLTAADFLAPGQIVMLGRPPSRVDFLTSITGREFEDCWPRRQIIDMDGVPLPVIALDDLLANKRATGRTKDLADVEEFERARNRQSD
jgi:hypothetical protein